MIWVSLVACSVAQQATGSVQFQIPRKTKHSHFSLSPIRIGVVGSCVQFGSPTASPFSLTISYRGSFPPYGSPRRLVLPFAKWLSCPAFLSDFQPRSSVFSPELFAANSQLPHFEPHPAHSSLRPLSSSLTPQCGALIPSPLSASFSFMFHSHQSVCSSSCPHHVFF